MSDVWLRVTCPVRGVDAELAVSHGQHLALVGSNGAGKSTVLDAAAGLLGAGSAARVGFRVGGRDLSRARLGRRGAIELTQRPVLFSHMSVEDNVAFADVSRGMRRKEARAKAHEHLHRIGLRELATRKARELSGGQAQKVALARALAADPEVLLLDEPLAALDVRAAEEMRALIADVTEGQTLIFATHDVLDLGAWADSVAFVERGRIAWEGSRRAFFDRPPGMFGAALTGRAWVRGRREPGGPFVSAGGVRLPVYPGEQVAGEVEALVDPSAVSVKTLPTQVSQRWEEAGGDADEHFVPGRISRIGALTVRWVRDVPVMVQLGQIGPQFDAGVLRREGQRVRVVAHAPVPLRPAAEISRR